MEELSGRAELILSSVKDECETCVSLVLRKAWTSRPTTPRRCQTSCGWWSDSWRSCRLTKTPKTRRALSSTAPSSGWRRRYACPPPPADVRVEKQRSFLLLCPQLAEALQASSQIQAELSLQQKLREDSELRVEEMEESLLEKEQEVQRQQGLISRLQGEVLVPQCPAHHPLLWWLRHQDRESGCVCVCAGLWEADR